MSNLGPDPALYFTPLMSSRWYAEDLIHPSEPAKQFIMHHFQRKFMPKETQELCRRIDKINKNLQHRPQRVGSPSFVRHLKSTTRDIDTIRRTNPSVRWDWQEERLRELEAASSEDAPLIK